MSASEMTTYSSQAVPEHIASLSRVFPHSPALTCRSQSLSFGELNRKADQFAAHLARLGITRGETVAICMERSFDWIVAALGIMRAGAAYVPLDSAWPDSRLRFALSDCSARAVVACTGLLERLQIKAPGIDPCRDVMLIDSAPAVGSIPIEGDRLAYIVYTSGSSGTPKGVEITHANLNHLVRWHCSNFQVTEHDRASHIAGLAFDAAVWEIWPNLAAGATLCLGDDQVRTFPELLQPWLVREQITIAFAPTVLASQLVRMQWPAETSLRVLLTGGDVLQRHPPGELPFKLVNNYGPSECTVVATSIVLEPEAGGVPPIGLPMDGTSIYLLNEEGSPVCDGTVGEIHIGGSGVGRGYRNLPSLTRERFLPDTFSGKVGSRMYRTGDRGLRRGDGQIEFHGRLDRQVKIRGHRIELDEIANVLSAHPSLDFATVVISSSEDGESKLLAYVMPAKNVCVPTAAELQHHLQQHLPEHMIPPRFVLLDSIPMTSTGKIDFGRLKPPSPENLLRNQHSDLPLTAIEQTLLTLVKELLKNKDVEAGDNFFLAGAHSLMGMQLILRVQDTFDVNLTLLQLLNAPTIKQLTRVIESMLVEEIKSLSEEEAERLLSE